MCGRYTLTQTELQLSLFGISTPCTHPPQYNIAPRDQVLIVRQPEQQPELARASWGLAPSWLNDLSRVQINARSETLATKPMFRQAIRQRRCLILTDGYYEWQQIQKPERSYKQPYYFSLQGGGLFAFAGIWERYEVDPTLHFDSCAIITTPANQVTRPFHERMPAILNPRDYPTWLSSSTPLEACQALLQPAPENILQCYPVSTYINNPKHQTTRCTEAIALS